MERNLNNEDFEEFLKFKTDHYKLYPSEKVWKGIYQTLHTRKKWLRIGGSLLFLSTLLFVSYQFNDHSTPAASLHPQVKTIILQTDKPGVHTPAAPANHHTTTGAIAKGTISPDKRLSFNITEPSTAADKQPQPAGKVIEAEDTQMDIQPLTVVAATSENETESVTAPEETVNATAGIETAEALLHDRSEINWLQEMAAIRLSSAKRNRFNLQFYFSPTISYRKLTDGKKGKELSNIPLATNQLGVNNFVDHKPAIGVELGSNVLFNASRNLTLKTGLQLNYSRYTIKAYKFYFEKANIALLTSGRISDTMSSYTSLRNFNGYHPEQLQNQYLQLSLPVGAELKLMGNKRLQLNVSGTVQPSYLLYNDTYLLSTDFINYTKEPTLVRKWNVNTSAEAFISYYIGGMRWQVGPQFRYQTLSSYNDRYPINEYLIEYGVKFGVSKTLR